MLISPQRMALPRGKDYVVVVFKIKYNIAHENDAAMKELYRMDSHEL